MNIAPFDRESSYFEGHSQPQIQVKLNLNCATVETVAANITAFSESVQVDEIFFSKTMTYLNIIIVDQNDNAPVITNPSMTGFNIGFPDANLAEKLMPKYLMQVEAYDRDEGINAEIKFSLSDEDHFSIDGISGVIYPLKNCMADVDVADVFVNATDKNGAADGNSDSTLIVVNKLRTENVVVLSVENKALDDVEEVIEELSTESGIDVRVINFFAVPIKDDEVEGKQMGAETRIMIFAYAYSENRDLLESKEIVEALSSIQMISITTYETHTANAYKPSDCNLTGLIVAVSVLGSLLLLVVIGTPLIWFLWLRYKIVRSSRKNSDISTKKFEDDFNDEFGGRSSPIATAVVENESSASTQSDAEILGIQIEGAMIEGKQRKNL